jgi:hypothetical protein
MRLTAGLSRRPEHSRRPHPMRADLRNSVASLRCPFFQIPFRTPADRFDQRLRPVCGRQPGAAALRSMMWRVPVHGVELIFAPGRLGSQVLSSETSRVLSNLETTQERPDWLADEAVGFEPVCGSEFRLARQLTSRPEHPDAGLATVKAWPGSFRTRRTLEFRFFHAVLP